MTIRPRVPADLPGCVEALRLVHDADAYPLNWPRDPQAWLSPCEAAWVAVADDGRVAGNVAVQGDELTRLYVVPQARGHGLAYALVSEVRAWAAAHRRVLTLNVVAAERSAAIAFYESTGWRHTHTAVAEWSTPDGRPVELRYYVDRETEQRYWVDGPDPR